MYLKTVKIHASTKNMPQGNNLTHPIHKDLLRDFWGAKYSILDLFKVPGAPGAPQWISKESKTIKK